MISKKFFCSCKMVFTHMNRCMIRKNSLLKKENFYSHLNMEDITDADYTHAKRVCKDFEIKHLANTVI